ncbi:hypothetical protein [Andreprevotia sp. IGB-42]|uniref:hypothetical protein n=1 Tax=Andreprevotia sp. IGB-42 TaxID=2497473 RepID=UPI00135B205A|nr:hypothetical protein [Andreprevotia sp. IGB-42]
MNLHLVIPHADWPDHATRAAIVKVLAAPALNRLLGRGAARRSAPATPHAVLARDFAVAELAVAPLTLQLDAPAEEAGYWLRADPVHLRPDRDQLVMLDSRAFELTQAEADGLCDGLNHIFAEDGFRFLAATPYRWYLRLPADPHLLFTPFDDALGRDIDSLLPQGATALRWHKLLNEMQMCMYGHKVNDARVAAGKTAVNSVWPWGGGMFPPAARAVAPQARVYADDAVLAALTQMAGAAVQPLPASIADVQQDAYVLLPQLRSGALYGDAQAWYAGWQQLETDWLAPALAMLQSGRLASLRLSFPELGRDVTVTKGQLWHFWRGNRWPWEI